MGQITIYLDKKTEEKMRSLAKAMDISQSKWIANLIQERLQNEWPAAVVNLAGAWQTFPLAEEIREGIGEDSMRESV